MDNVVLRPTVPLIMARWVPAQVAGRAVTWLPDDLRRARNAAVYAAALELGVSAASMPLGAARGGLSRFSSGLHAVLTLVSLIGLLGSLKFRLPHLLFHSAVAVGLVGLFVLYVILVRTVSQGDTTQDGILYVIFISLVVDLAAGLVTGRFGLKLYRFSAALQAARSQEVATEGAERPVTYVAPRGPTVVLDMPPAPEYRRQLQAAQRHGLHEVEAAGGPVLPPNAGLVIRALNAGDGHQAPCPSPEAAAAVNTANSDALGAAAEGVPAPAPLMNERWVGSGPTDDGRCGICMEAPRNAAFFECGHMACFECATRLRREPGRCHLCRKRIRAVVRVYP
jgi:hypothetical protein